MSALAPEADTPAPVAPPTARALEAFFTAIGAEPAAFDRKEPLDIAHPDRCWAVVDGKVDLFFVSPPDDSGITRRTFLLRAEAGQVIFGLTTDLEKPAEDHDRTVYGLRSGFGIKLAEGWKIIGVPVPGTRCLGTKVERLSSVGSASELRQLVQLVDEWVNLLCAAMRMRDYPKKFEHVKPGEDRVLQATNVVTAAHGAVVWVTVRKGRVQVNGVNDAGLTRGQGMPISEDAWLQCEGDVELHCESTEQVIMGSRVQALLLKLQNRFVARAVIGGELDQASNRKRIEKKEEDARKFVASALRRLNQVIEPRMEADEVGAESEPLLRALRAIGRVVGIDFKPLPIRRDETAPASSLEAYVRQARARHRVVALRGRWWKVDNGPLLGFLEGNQAPVALLPAKGGYVMRNPDRGTDTPVTDEVALTLSPMAHAFYRGFGDGAMNVISLMRFGSYGLVREVALVLFIGVAVGGLGLLSPYVTGIVFDTVIPGAQRGPLTQLALIMLGAAFATAMFEVSRSFTMLRIEGKMDASIQAAVWDRLLRLPVPFFRDYGAGDLAMRANGINSIRQQLSGSTVHSILSALFSVFNFFLLFYYSSKLAWVATALVAVQVILTIAFGFIRVGFERQIAEVSGRLASVVLEFLSGIAKLRTTGSEARAFGRWAERHAQNESLLMRARFIGNVMTTINAVYPLICTGVIFFAVAYFSKEEKVFSTGEYLAFNTAFGAFMGAVVSFTSIMMSLVSIVPTYERAKPILQGTPEASQDMADPGVLSGDIEVSGLTFKYSEDGPAVLSNVSIAIKPGEFVAFVGPSGSGKSTLLRLLLGFEKPTSGSVFYDGQDLASLDINAVRRQIGVVLQNGQLLAGDIFSNIVGSSNLTIDDAKDAAKACGLDGDIDRMPMGMHTLIPDGGGTLSGGQRQRLLIARAIVTKPRILCFDEATSALDNRNQAIVTGSLDQLKATRIVIAHRLSTIINADRIFVLVGGKLLQQGNFESLMAEEGVFRELARRQMV